MRILSLRLKNLNSLKGEWKIDFAAEPFAVDANEPLRLSATTGLVRLQSSMQTGLIVLKSASAALKEAKRFQRGKSLYFEANQADAARDRIRMLNRLRT